MRSRKLTMIIGVVSTCLISIISIIGLIILISNGVKIEAEIIAIFSMSIMLAGNQTTNIVKDYFSNKHFIETNNNTSDIRKKLPEQQSIAEVEEVSTEDLSANPPI